jgi:neopullulanase
MKHSFFVALLLTALHAGAQSPVVDRIDPTNWFVGMRNPTVQLLLYGKNIGAARVSIRYPGVTVRRTQPLENPNYLAVDLNLAPTTRPGTFPITLTVGGQTVVRPYELKPRPAGPKAQGLTPADFVYLIMPDRFANGDPANDRFRDMRDTLADVKNPYLRHGGDFLGVGNHLDYLQELGVTTLWMTPVIDNDETLKAEAPDRNQAGYHGYHFTDHYQIDRRFGGTNGYVALSAALHKRGMKLVQDAVYNHVSDDHWFYRDRPARDWFNNWPAYTGSNHKEQPLYDPHGAEADRKLLLDGWFTPFLPDLNQRNPVLANYLIQHAIWSTETFGLDGWRIDTYKYNDPAFLNRCNQALLDEYPALAIFGESAVGSTLSQAYFAKNTVGFPYKSNQPGALDFTLSSAIVDGLNQDFGWDSGLNRIQQTLAQDGLYANPDALVTFLDNHDTDRFLAMVGNDAAKYRMGVTLLLTLRGIPHWYYGSEIGMNGTKNPTDAEVRKDFPGGFPGDKTDKFTSAGRSKAENELFDFVKKMANYRRVTPALQTGKLTQFVPQNDTYVYFRHTDRQTVMVALNSGKTPKTLDLARFAERLTGFSGALNVMTGEVINGLNTLTLPPKSATVLELRK